MNILFLTVSRITSIVNKGIYSDLLRLFIKNGHSYNVFALRISFAVTCTSYSSSIIDITDNAANEDHSSNSRNFVSSLKILTSVSSNKSEKFNIQLFNHL